jgi:hypothetical protein
MTAATREEAAGLAPGDVVEFEGERYELLCAPFLGRTGGSVFDDFRVFWRARIRSLRDAADVRLGTWWGAPPRRSA